MDAITQRLFDTYGEAVLKEVGHGFDKSSLKNGWKNLQSMRKPAIGFSMNSSIITSTGQWRLLPPDFTWVFPCYMTRSAVSARRRSNSARGSTST